MRGPAERAPHGRCSGWSGFYAFSSPKTQKISGRSLSRYPTTFFIRPSTDPGPMLFSDFY